MITAGALSKVSVGNTTASLSATAASGGTGPYTQQWYRSTSPGFTPGIANLVSGATALTLNDSGLSPGQVYYYKVVYTDALAAVATSLELAVQIGLPLQNPNQFAQSVICGQLDQHLNLNTIPVQIDLSEPATDGLVAGTAVKLVDSADGVPKVIACDSEGDEVFGFLNYNIKNRTYKPGDRAEMSIKGNVMYLFATHAYARGERLSLDLAVPGGVQVLPSSASTYVGWAFDKGVVGQLCRVYIESPSFIQGDSF